MSIASEITRLQNAKDALKSSIEAKGVTVDPSATLDSYSGLVDSIPDASAGCPIYAVRFTAVDPSDDYDITIPVGVLTNGVLPAPRVFDRSKNVVISVYGDPSIVENINQLRVRCSGEEGSTDITTFDILPPTPTYVTVGGKQLVVYSQRRNLDDIDSIYFEHVGVMYKTVTYIDFMVP